MKSYILDASSILAFTNNEKGFEFVKELVWVSYVSSVTGNDSRSVT